MKRREAYRKFEIVVKVRAVFERRRVQKVRDRWWKVRAVLWNYATCNFTKVNSIRNCSKKKIKIVLGTILMVYKLNKYGKKMIS